jgi:uncharacterized protein YegJ (DUF2314 family)
MKLKMKLAVALLAAAFAGGAVAAQQGKPRDNTDGGTIVDVQHGDPEMAAAVRRSRAELPAFYARMAAPGPGESGFMVKYDILPGDGAELIWAGDLDRSRTPMTGRLANQPERVPLQRGDQVTIPEDAIVDWSYVRGGVLEGAYTQRLIVDRMPPDQAAQWRREFGW